jgi:hypothetical protein
VWNKINKDMRINEFLHRGEQAPRAYASPQADVFHLRAEGVLCASYGDPNAPGKDLGQENEWDF